MTSDLDRIKSVLGPPVDAVGRPVEVAPADWSEIEGYLSLRLPASFTGFVDCYGSGTLGLIVFSHPAVEPDSPLHGWGDLLSRIKWGEHYLRHRRERAANPYPIHPEPGGLIAWGTSGDEYQFFFRADPADEPERWPIVWNDGGWDSWDEFPGPFGTFLWDLMSGRLPAEIVGEGYSYDRFDPHGLGIETRHNAGRDPEYVPTDE